MNALTCHACQSQTIKKNGSIHNRKGKYKCLSCKRAVLLKALGVSPLVKIAKEFLEASCAPVALKDNELHFHQVVE
jgi:hypothetical protein